LAEIQYQYQLVLADNNISTSTHWNFRQIPGLINYTEMTGGWGLLLVEVTVRWLGFQFLAIDPQV